MQWQTIDKWHIVIFPIQFEIYIVIFKNLITIKFSARASSSIIEQTINRTRVSNQEHSNNGKYFATRCYHNVTEFASTFIFSATTCEKCRFSSRRLRAKLFSLLLRFRCRNHTQTHTHYVERGAWEKEKLRGKLDFSLSSHLSSNGPSIPGHANFSAKTFGNLTPGQHRFAYDTYTIYHHAIFAKSTPAFLFIISVDFLFAHVTICIDSGACESLYVNMYVRT